MMKLFYTKASPPSRAVLMTIRWLGVEVELIEIDLMKNEQKSEEFLKINPRGLVPVLVDGDFILTESRAIMVFLVTSRNNPILYPFDAKKRALIDSRLYFDATEFCPLLPELERPIFFNGAKEVSPELREKFKKIFNLLENFLNESLYFSGDKPTLADISILSTFLLYKCAFGNLGNLPNIDAWHERCKSLTGYEENLAYAETFIPLLEQFGVKLAPLE